MTSQKKCDNGLFQLAILSKWSGRARKREGAEQVEKSGLDKLEKAFARTMLLISQLWMQKYGRKWNIGQNCQENGVRQMRACVVIQMFCEFQTLSRTQAGSLSRPPSGGVLCLAGGAVKTCCHIYPGWPFGSPSLWKVGGQSGTCNKLSPHRNHYKLRSSCLGSKGSGPVDWPCDSEVICGPELEM